MDGKLSPEDRGEDVAPGINKNMLKDVVYPVI